jgi:hypothetical protein
MNKIHSLIANERFPLVKKAGNVRLFLSVAQGETFRAATTSSVVDGIEYVTLTTESGFSITIPWVMVSYHEVEVKV